MLDRIDQIEYQTPNKKQKTIQDDVDVDVDEQHREQYTLCK